jgi:Ca2+-binding RTX toxin-like protein
LAELTALVNLNFVVGSAHNDTLTGSNGPDLFEQFDGGLGDDVIDGGTIDTVTHGQRQPRDLLRAPRARCRWT